MAAGASRKTVRQGTARGAEGPPGRRSGGEVEREQPLAIARRPLDRRLGVAQDLEPEVARRRRDRLERRAALRVVPDDAALPDLALADLELRLHEKERVPAGPQDGLHGGEDEPERDEGEVPGDEVHPLAERRGVEEARVLPLAHDDARVAAELRVELPVPDVHREHPRRAALEEEVREAAGGGPEVGADLPARIDREGIERLLELEGPAGDVARRRRVRLQPDRQRRVDERAGLVHPRLADHHRAGHDERLRLRAGLGEPALDQQQVDSSFPGHAAPRAARAFASSRQARAIPSASIPSSARCFAWSPWVTNWSGSPSRRTRSPSATTPRRSSASRTAEPNPPSRQPSSTVRIRPERSPSATTRSSSSGFTNRASTTETARPVPASASAAATAGRTVEPTATTQTSGWPGTARTIRPLPISSTFGVGSSGTPRPAPRGNRNAAAPSCASAVWSMWRSSFSSDGAITTRFGTQRR